MKNSYVSLSRPHFIGREKKYLQACVDTGWVSSVGPYVSGFEAEVARWASCRFAVACVNGTSALHTAFMLAGIKAGDEIIMPTLTFAAPAFAAKYCGAYPVFMDAEADYWQMDTQKLADFLNTACTWKNKSLVNKKTKRPVKAIAPVHILGHPVDMDPLMRLARQFNLLVIEDVAESIGATYKGRKLGGIGHLGCFSFNGNKTITAGGGGMVTTNKEALAKRAKYLTTQAKDEGVEYIHREIGYNYRLTNVQAAIGLAQLECLPENIKRKRKLAKAYALALKDMPGISIPQQAPWAESIWWLYTVLIDRKKYGLDSRGVMALMKKENIETRPLWHPLHSLALFKDSYAHQVTVAPALYRDALSLPSSACLDEKEQARVISVLKKGRRAC